MAKSKAQRRRKSGERVRVDARQSPTPEAMRHGDYTSAGMAYRRTPVIDTLLARGHINDREHRALAFYREQAGLSERSPRSCLDMSVRGNGDNPLPAVITSALLTTARIERDLGALQPLTRAVAVDDVSLTQWCVDKFGGRERLDGDGKLVAVVPINEKKHVEQARLELRYAAGMIVP